ncbi:MAG: 50S ribosomal protein L5 [Thermomicrobia bacterium]|nr:50S ribosomal protein L5 [Thermomicrobia bacterium]
MAAEARTQSAEPRQIQRLRKQFDEVAVPALTEQFGYTNLMQVPKVQKIVINIGMGEAVGNAKALDNAVGDLQIITGQKPVVTRAKRSIAQFKIRQGMPIGVMVTLRGARMYEFMDRLFNIAMPRVRDFRGLSPDAFDGHGNYTLGLKEQLIFPEIEYDKIDRVRGMEISFVTSARNDAEGRRLLEMLGMPYSRPQGQAGGVQRIAS